MFSCNENGKAFIELAFVLPFLFFTGFGTIEALKDSRHRQYMSVATREVARASFPRCLINDPNPAERTTKVRNCFDEVVDNVLPAGGGGALDGADTTIALWEFVSAAQPARLIARYQTGTQTSRYTGAVVQGFQSYNANKGLIITVETYFTVTPIIDWFSGTYYETSII